MGESRKQYYERERPEESYCQPCLRNGHQCMTSNHNGKEFICVFCEDGVACPIMKAAVKPTNGFRTTGIAPALTNGHAKDNPTTMRNGSVAAAGTGSIGSPSHAGKSVVKPVKTGGRGESPEPEAGRQSLARPASDTAPLLKSKKETSMKERSCSVSGCSQQLRINSPHDTCVKHRVKEAAPVCKCGEKIRRDNESGLCKACKVLRRAEPTKAPTLAKQKSAKGGAAVNGNHRGAPPDRVSLHVTETQLDDFFVKLPLDYKTKLINAHLADSL